MLFLHFQLFLPCLRHRLLLSCDLGLQCFLLLLQLLQSWLGLLCRCLAISNGLLDLQQLFLSGCQLVARTLIAPKTVCESL